MALALLVVALAIALLAFQRTGLSFDLNGAHPSQSSAQSASDAAQHANIAINSVLLVVMFIMTVWAARLFDFRPRRDPDFAWVVGTRLLMMLGINTVQAFLQYYFHDILGSQNQEQQTSNFVIAVTLAGALSTFFGGWLSTRYGRKRMVYLSGGIMTAVAAIFISLNFLITAGVVSQSTGLIITLVSGGIFGLGYGAYLSVDWALVADVLPSQERYARDMGIWNIALTIPQVTAFIIGSILLSLAIPPAFRYTFLFLTFIVYSLAGTITVRYIKKVKCHIPSNRATKEVGKHQGKEDGLQGHVKELFGRAAHFAQPTIRHHQRVTDGLLQADTVFQVALGSGGDDLGVPHGLGVTHRLGATHRLSPFLGCRVR